MTFLFTDVEGSTRLLSALGDQYRSLLATHAQILRASIAAHAGMEVSTEGDAYVGLDVHRAARIAAAGHGGQVVLSDASRTLVAQDLPDGTAMRDLGLHRLKDLPAPERIWQLEIDGLVPGDLGKLPEAPHGRVRRRVGRRPSTV